MTKIIIVQKIKNKIKLNSLWENETTLIYSERELGD